MNLNKMLLHSNIKVKIILLFSLFAITVSMKNTHNANSGYAEVKRNQAHLLSDMPKKSDLNIYINSLEKIIKFCMNHKNYIDINFNFGLFITNVNLKTILKTKGKNVTAALRIRLNEMTKQNDKLQSFFAAMVRKNAIRDPRHKMVYSLFTDEASWIEKSQKVNSFVLKKRTMPSRSHKQLEKMFQTWITYLRNIDRIEEWKPDPKHSDMCLASVGSNPTSHSYSIPQCKIAPHCYDMVVNGSDFGYALTHRLLFLEAARFARGCAVFTPQLDRELTRRFCSTAYNEAEYIAQHGYKVVDLMFEQIFLCGFIGHVQFLRRTWIANLLQSQTIPGCFGQALNNTRLFDEGTVTSWKLMKSMDEQAFMHGQCNGHITSAAAATISTAVKYIILNPYFK